MRSQLRKYTSLTLRSHEISQKMSTISQVDDISWQFIVRSHYVGIILPVIATKSHQLKKLWPFSVRSYETSKWDFLNRDSGPGNIDFFYYFTCLMSSDLQQRIAPSLPNYRQNIKVECIYFIWVLRSYLKHEISRNLESEKSLIFVLSSEMFTKFRKFHL